MNQNTKDAIIIGGGRGLGEYLSKHLSNNDYNVAVVDINLENALAVADSISKTGKKAKGYYLNACDEVSVENTFSEIKQDFEHIYLMVYNAGAAKSTKITDFDIEDFHLCLNVNLVGYFLCAREIAKIMIENGTKGRIIQINSKSGKVGSKYNAGYSAAKFGGVGLTQSLALDLAEHGISVNSLMLGNLLNSDMFQSLIPSYAKKLGLMESEVIPYYIDKVPLMRGCEFEDVANVLTFYASEKAGYCTGQSVNITGGQVMF